MKTASVTLLENASASGDAQQWPGGRGQFVALGTFDGESVSLEFQGPDGTTWIPVPDIGGTAIELSANGSKIFELAPCPIRAVVSADAEGDPTGLYAAAARVPQ